MFVEITHSVLKDLQKQGYTVLKSPSEWGSESPTYRAAAVENVDAYLMSMQIKEKLTGNEHFLVISEALTIPEEQLFGVVWI